MADQGNAMVGYGANAHNQLVNVGDQVDAGVAYQFAATHNQLVLLNHLVNANIVNQQLQLTILNDKLARDMKRTSIFLIMLGTCSIVVSLSIHPSSSSLVSICL